MAYGTNAPFGFQPRYYLNGSTWNDQTRQYRIASGYNTSLYFGDPVTVLADGTIGIATIGGAILGVFQGVEYTDVSGNYVFSQSWTAGTVTKGALVAKCFVVDDPNVIFSVQVSTSSNANPAVAIGMTQASIFDNAKFGIIATTNAFAPVAGPGGTYQPLANPGAGSVLTGQSGYYLDATTIATGNPTYSCKIIDLEPNVNPNQVFYVAGQVGPPFIPTIGVFNNALVIFNNHIYKGGTGTAGV